MKVKQLIFVVGNIQLLVWSGSEIPNCVQNMIFVGILVLLLGGQLNSSSFALVYLGVA